MDNQKHQKDTFYTRQPCLHSAVFLTTCTPTHPIGAHMCAPIHYTCTHECTPVHSTGTLSSMPVHHTRVHISALVQLTSAHMCATVQPTGALIVHALNPLNRAHMRVYPMDRCTRVHAYYWIAHACGAHTP
jgi:hypothetical protein